MSIEAAAVSERTSAWSGHESGRPISAGRDGGSFAVRVKATIEYHGAAYAGWQAQPDQPTVQVALEKALQVATRTSVRVEGAGRTDAGVHALGQVAAFNLADGVDLYRLRASLNGLTGNDIAVIELIEVPSDFDPRRRARRRSYRYTVVSGRPPSPLLDDRSWHVAPQLDANLLERLAEQVCGTHDFSAFRASDCEAPTTRREVMQSQWHAQAGILTYDITATAFLKHMVRVLVGTMVDVALAKIPQTRFAELLAGGDRRRAGRTAPAKGLTLLSVEY